MNYQLNSLEKSPTVQTLLEKNRPASYENFNPKVKTTYPSIARQTVRQSPNIAKSGDIFGASMDFKIPNDGRLSKMFIKLDVACTTNGSGVATYSYFGAQLPSVAVIKHKSKIVANSDKTHMLQMIKNSEASKASIITDKTKLVLANSETAVIHTVYIPLDFWFGQKSEMYLDTRIVQDLELHVEFDTKANMLVNAGFTAHTFSDLSLVCTYVNLDPFYNDSLNKSLYPSAKPLSVYGYDNVRELVKQLTYSSGTTLDFTIVPDVKFLASSLHASAYNRNTGLDMIVSKVKLTSSNSPIFDLFAGESVLSNGFGVGKTDADQNFSIFHGVDKDMSYFSGGINWDKITSPVLTVTLDTSSGATNGDVIDVTINHTLITTFVINPATGAIDIGGTN